MGFINWLNLKKYIRRGTDSEVARIGHVNAVYDAATKLPKVDSLNGLQGDINLTGAPSTVRGGEDWSISVEASLETLSDLNLSITKPYGSGYFILQPDEVPTVSIVYTDIKVDEETYLQVIAERVSQGLYAVIFDNTSGFDPSLCFINVYQNSIDKAVTTQLCTGERIIIGTYQTSASGELEPVDFGLPIYIEFKVFQ
jgi:hypothetical protein